MLDLGIAEPQTYDDVLALSGPQGEKQHSRSTCDYQVNYQALMGRVNDRLGNCCLEEFVIHLFIPMGFDGDLRKTLT